MRWTCDWVLLVVGRAIFFFFAGIMFAVVLCPMLEWKCDRKCGTILTLLTEYGTVVMEVRCMVCKGANRAWIVATKETVIGQWGRRG